MKAKLFGVLLAGLFVSAFAPPGSMFPPGSFAPPGNVVAFAPPGSMMPPGSFAPPGGMQPPGA